jgi:hypothetical protein
MKRHLRVPIESRGFYDDILVSRKVGHAVHHVRECKELTLDTLSQATAVEPPSASFAKDRSFNHPGGGGGGMPANESQHNHKC